MSAKTCGSCRSVSDSPHVGWFRLWLTTSNGSIEVDFCSAACTSLGMWRMHAQHFGLERDVRDEIDAQE